MSVSTKENEELSNTIYSLSETKTINEISDLSNKLTMITKPLDTVSENLSKSKIIYILCVSGQSCSGKTTVVNKLKTEIENEYINVIMLSQDYYYIGCKGNENGNDKNYDVPEAIEWSLLIEHIIALKKGESIERPQYNFKNHRREKERIKIEIKKPSILIIEGILVFNNLELLKLCDKKIYVDASSSKCFYRRLNRDKNERGRDEIEITTRYFKDVEISNKMYVKACRSFADIELKNENENEFISLEFLIDHVKMKIMKTIKSNIYLDSE